MDLTREVCQINFESKKYKRACCKEHSYKLRISTRRTKFEPLEKVCLTCKEIFHDTTKKKLQTVCKPCQMKDMVRTRRERGSYTLSEERKKQISDDMHQRYARGWNPNTLEHREKLSVGLKQRWASGEMSTDETRRKMRIAARERFFRHMGDHKYTSAKSGKRPDLGDVYFRSGWEANFARILNFQGKTWEFENKTFAH